MNESSTINIGHGLTVWFGKCSTLNKFTEAFASASEKNKSITKTKAS